MDIISQFPDDLLLGILSFFPTKDVIVTSLLSKRWQNLWRLMSKLEYDFISQDRRFTQFVYRCLLKSKAPIVEKLDLKNLNLGPECSAVDVGIWIDTAVSRRVRELKIAIHCSKEGPFKLPNSLYTCETLESFTLTIKNCGLVGVPLAVSLPCMKKLYLRCIGWVDKGSLLRLISGCSNLEELLLARPDGYGDYMRHKAGHTTDFTIDMPSLRRWLFFERMFGKGSRDVINAAPLKYLCISDDILFDSRRIEKMPDLVMARIAASSGFHHKYLEKLTHVTRIYLCLPFSDLMNPSGLIFPHLVELKICTCTQGWWDVLADMLQGSPKLRVLTLTNEHCGDLPSLEMPVCWKRPSSVPACLLSSLRDFKWTRYKGRQRDREVATYVLRNATGLKRAIFSTESTDFKDKFQMLKELASVPTPSPSCQRLFD